MKMKKLGIILGGLLAAVAVVKATTVVFTDYIVNEPVLAYSQNFQLDLKTAGKAGLGIDQLSAQATYSSATVAAVTFTDGGVSTGNISVANNSALVGVKATNQITVSSTSTLKNAHIVVNGKMLRNGRDWFTKDTTALTATDIARILTLVYGIDANASGSVVYATATVAGTAGNSITLSISRSGSGLTVAHATFTGGVDNGIVTVNGVALTQGTDWTRASTSSGTAKAISDAIMANSTLNAIIKSTWTSAGVVYATSTAVGVNAYALVGYPASALTVSAATMSGGSAKAYTSGGTTITKTAHGLYTGLGVVYSTGSAVGITNFTPGSTYYVIRVDADNFKLASSLNNATAGTAIVLGSAVTTGPHNFILTPQNTTGTFGLKWQISNDGSTWTDLSVSSISFASPYTAASTYWDFGTVSYRYIRLVETAGSAGAINLQISGYGKNTD